MMTNELLAGTAKKDVTPPLDIPYLGYVPRHARFREVHDPLHARALTLARGETRVALLSVDAIGFHHGILGPGRDFRQELGTAVQQRAGIPSEGVLLAASHAHSTPETLDIRPLWTEPGAVEWLECLIRQLAETVADAVAAQQPARLKFGRTPVRGIAANRRQVLADGRFYQPAQGPPQAPVVRSGPLEEQAGVLVVEFADGAFSVVVNFACHAVTVQAQPRMSADYPGVACELVERSAQGCRHCLFTQGAAGDVNPLRGGQRPDFGDVHRYGEILAGAVLGEVGRLRAADTGSLPPILDSAWRRLALPVRSLPDPEPFRQRMESAQRAADQASSARERRAYRERARLEAEALRAIELGSEPLPAPVQILRLGDVALIGCPGELFTGLGQEIVQQAVAPHAVVVGYANDYAGYLATPAAYAEGGYETRLGAWCRAAPGAGRRVVDAALEGVLELWRR